MDDLEAQIRSELPDHLKEVWDKLKGLSPICPLEAALIERLMKGRGPTTIFLNKTLRP